MGEARRYALFVFLRDGPLTYHSDLKTPFEVRLPITCTGIHGLSLFGISRKPSIKLSGRSIFRGEGSTTITYVHSDYY